MTTRTTGKELERRVQRLEQEVELLASVAACIPGAIYRFVRYPDGRTEVPFMSEGACGIFERTVKDLQDPERLFKDVHHEDLHGLWASIEDSARSMAPWKHEFRIVLDGGRQKWLQGLSVPRVLDHGGTCWDGVLLDISHRKGTEAELLRSKRVAEGLLEAMHDGFAELDAAGVHRRVNKAFCRMTGFSQGELIGTAPPHPYWPPEALDRIEKAYQQTLRGAFREHELTFMRKDGERFPVIVSPSSLKDEQGRVIRFLATVKDVTVRKIHEEQLRESEARYRRLMEESPLSIEIYEPDGLLVDLNRKTWERMWGLKADDVIGRFNGLENEGLQGLEAFPIRKRLFEGERVPPHEIEFDPGAAGFEGDPKWLRSHGYHLYDAEGNLKNVVVLNEDITEQKRAEEETRRVHHLLDSWMQNSPAVAFIKDLDGRITYVNPAFESLFDLSPGEILGKTDFDLYPSAPETAEQMRANDRLVIEQGRPVALEETVVAAGEPRDFETHKFPLRDLTGRIVGLAGMAVDITKRKRAERALIEKEERFKQLVETIDEIFWVRDARTFEMLYLSPGFEDIFGIPRETVYQDALAFANLVDPEDIPAIQAAHEQQRTQGVVTTTEYRIHRADGEMRWIRAKASPVFDPQGSLSRIVGIATDITDRKALEESLRRHSEHLEELVDERTRALKTARDQLVRQEKLALLGQLAGGVGHELRNPLGAIKNAAYYLGLVLEDPEAETRDTLEILNREVANSEKIIQSLFDVADPKRPRIRTGVSLNDLVREILSLLDIPSPVEVREVLAPDLPLIPCDPEQMTQAFRNLLRNGVQAMREGGTLTVRSGVLKDGSVEIQVSDTGEGIPEENLAKIFEPLFTTKAKGIGLGLALSKNHIEAHGGTLSVESEEGEGTRFAVRLPPNPDPVGPDPEGPH